MFAEIQKEFAAALLDAQRPVPRAVMAHTCREPAKRFAVYRNNVVVGLIGAMRARFPATEKIVGEEFFAAMAHVFVARHPPRSPLLMYYGDRFADFIRAFEPAAELPYLPDVAYLEAARTYAYHAKDQRPVDPGILQNLDPQSLYGARIELHPSSQILRFEYPVVTIWAMNSGEAPLGPVTETHAEDALVVRPFFDVSVRKLPSGGAAFLQALKRGVRLGEAAEAATTEAPGFDLTLNLAGMIQCGVMTGVRAKGGRAQ